MKHLFVSVLDMSAFLFILGFKNTDVFSYMIIIILYILVKKSFNPFPKSRMREYLPYQAMWRTR